MKKYSDKKFEESIKDLKIEVVNENLLTDFLKVAKKKFFDKNIFISTEIANEAKKVFSETFISSFEKELKFKKFRLSNIIYSPSDVIKTVQVKLFEKLEYEYEHPGSSSQLFSFTEEGEDYQKNTSLLAECYKIVNEIENWIKDNLDLVLSETYQLNSVNMKSEATQRFVKSFKGIFLEIFASTEDSFRKNLNLSLDDFSKRSEFTHLAYKVIKELKKITKKSPQPLDIPNMYVNDDLYVVDDTPTEITDDQAEELVHTLKESDIYALLKLYSKKYRQFIPPREIANYADIIKYSYKEAIIRNKSLKRPNKNQVVEIMKEYLDSLGFEKNIEPPKPAETQKEAS